MVIVVGLVGLSGPISDQFRIAHGAHDERFGDPVAFWQFGTRVALVKKYLNQTKDRETSQTFPPPSSIVVSCHE